MIPALVLTAGMATRLRPLSLVRAKAALPVAGAPLVRRILHWLAAGTVTDIVLNLHYLPHTITRIVGDGADLGLRVRYSWETPVLGSAGGPRRAIPLLPSSPFLIINGDTITALDIRTLVDHHRATGALVTMAVVPNAEPDKYTGLILDGDDVVSGVAKRGSSQPSWHYFGVQVAEARAFADVPDNVPYESVGALYPALNVRQRGSVRAYRCTAEYLDIGTPSDYLATSLHLSALEGTPLIGARTHIDATAQIERSVLWDDVTVEAGAMLKECVVTDGVRVPADTSWHGVSIRMARGDLAPGERHVEGLAIAAL